MKNLMIIALIAVVLVFFTGIGTVVAQPGLPSPPDQAPLALSALLAMTSGALGVYLLRKRR